MRQYKTETKEIILTTTFSTPLGEMFAATSKKGIVMLCFFTPFNIEAKIQTLKNTLDAEVIPANSEIFDILKIQIRYEFLMCVLGFLGLLTTYNIIVFSRFSNYLLPFYSIALADIFIGILRSNKLSINKIFLLSTIIFIVPIYGYISFYWPVEYYTKWVPYYSIFSNESISNKFIDRDY